MNIRKPKFWDYKKPNIYAYILYPIAFLIKVLVFLKKKCTRINKKRKIKTICIGNIYVGGTGKTSLCLKIHEILKKKKIKSCFIKKFYNAQVDEQKLLKKKGELFLSSKRMQAIIEAEKQNYEIAICDDGLQDSSVEYDLKFVCFNSINSVGNGMTLPSGPLRESIQNLKLYEHVFINGNLENSEDLIKQILKINSKIKIYFGKYEPINLDEFSKDENYFVFSGIGNHQTFVSMIKSNGLKIIRDLEFPDHYQYTKNDINQILENANKIDCKVITTEKDFYRLKNINDKKIKFIKSELKIINEQEIENLIL
ncbi:tetraacyldisaccharide 4'-kinase [Candidatus Pelagibacter sp.]|uniref:tetraacyldisaccharide 4'-kinase n=1 Tax=Candidatus Pelagibacter sp. TaxID=2024849 RepID=UPI003F87DD5A